MSASRLSRTVQVDELVEVPSSLLFEEPRPRAIALLADQILHVDVQVDRSLLARVLKECADLRWAVMRFQWTTDEATWQAFSSDFEAFQQRWDGEYRSYIRDEKSDRLLVDVSVGYRKAKELHPSELGVEWQAVWNAVTNSFEPALESLNAHIRWIHGGERPPVGGSRRTPAPAASDDPAPWRARQMRPAGYH